MGRELASRCVTLGNNKKEETAGRLRGGGAEPAETGLGGRGSLQTVIAVRGMAQPPRAIF